MAYVPDHIADVFISYCHQDDCAWIERFRQDLSTILARKLRARTKPTIFFDSRDLRAGRSFDAEIAGQLAKTGFFLAMVSPQYNASTYCRQKELAEFLRRQPLESGRLIQIQLDLSAALPVDKSLAVPFVNARGPLRPDTDDYQDALRRVYEPIACELDRLYAESKMVFLAWPGDEPLEDERKRLESEIEGRGLRVYPEAVAEYESDVRLRDALQQSMTSVHLFGDPPNSFDIRQWAFSPDGWRVVTASDDQTARVWNAVTGKPIGDPMRLGGTTPSAEFSPDGRRVVTSSTRGGTQVWNADTGKPAGASLPIGNSRARFSPDGRRLVTVYGSKAQVWDADTGKPVGAAMQNRDGISSASFSPDGTRVVTASFEKVARVWDAVTGKPVGAPMQHSGGIVYSAAFSPDGRLVATAGDDNTARIWDAETGRPAGAPLPHDRPNSVKSAAFSPAGRRLATADSSGKGRVWMVQLACCGSQAEANRLASLMEAVSGYEVSDTGSLTFIGLDEQRRRLAELRRISGDRPAAEFGVGWMIRRISGR